MTALLDECAQEPLGCQSLLLAFVQTKCRGCDVRELVEIWQRLPGCERQPDGSFYSALFEVTFFCNKENVLERGDDLPSVIWDNGTTEHWHENERHRPAGGPTLVAPQPTRVRRVSMTEDGLAETTADGMPLRREPLTTMVMPAARTEQVVEAWHIHGKLSRDNGPAQTLADGTKTHYVDGQLHRVGGPAIEYPRPYGSLASGPDDYFVRGRRHRIDGAARVAARIANDDALGFGEYWIEGHHEPDVRTRYAVLKHYTGESGRPRLDVNNIEAWQHLETAGAISRSAERIEPTALAAALRLFPN